MVYPRPLGLAVLSLLPAHSSIQRERAVLTLEELNALASGVQSVFVSAYDGESLVVWSRKGGHLQGVPAGLGMYSAP